MWMRESVSKHVEEGGAAQQLLFLGHTPKRADAIDASCLRQRFPRAFMHEGVVYDGTHVMMEARARLAKNHPRDDLP